LDTPPLLACFSRYLVTTRKLTPPFFLCHSPLLASHLLVLSFPSLAPSSSALRSHLPPVLGAGFHSCCPLLSFLPCRFPPPFRPSGLRPFLHPDLPAVGTLLPSPLPPCPFSPLLPACNPSSPPPTAPSPCLLPFSLASFLPSSPPPTHCSCRSCPNVPR
jgi:hypothetical protein